MKTSEGIQVRQYLAFRKLAAATTGDEHIENVTLALGVAVGMKQATLQKAIEAELEAALVCQGEKR